MNKKDLIKYWIKSSDQDIKAMDHLFNNKDYHWSLFLGHLVIEKLLKAYYVKKQNNNAPPIHNLLRIAEKSKLKIDNQQEDLLATLSTFNIRTRYDDYKLEFYKMCTRDFTANWLKQIKRFRKWIKKKLSDQ